MLGRILGYSNQIEHSGGSEENSSVAVFPFLKSTSDFYTQEEFQVSLTFAPPMPGASRAYIPTIPFVSAAVLPWAVPLPGWTSYLWPLSPY